MTDKSPKSSGSSETGVSAEYAVAVDLGGTNVRAAFIEKKPAASAKSLAIVNQTRHPLDKSSPEALLHVMAACVSEALKAGAPQPERPPLGIGVAMKGFVDYRTGITISSGFLDMKNVPVGPFLSRRFGLPAFVANDVQAATIGEMFYGAGRDFRDFIYLNVGTGIATGLVFGRRLYRGAANLSGEFGHITVNREGRPCPCGRVGCLEKVVSGPGIIARAREKIEGHPESALRRLIESGEINATAVFELAEGGDEAARQVMQESAAYLGDGIVNLVNLLNPEAIVLGGGVFSGAHAFVRLLEEHVRSHAIGEAVKSLAAFEMSKLSVENAGLFGAGGLVFEHDKIE